MKGLGANEGIDSFFRIVYTAAMSFSPIVQTLYADLLQQLQDRGEQQGTVYRQRKNGLAFFYVKRTVGSSRLDEYLGPVTDPATLERVRAIRQEQSLSRQRRKIVAALKQSGMPAPSLSLARVLDAVSQAGLFGDGVLVGTAAYQCYPPVVGSPLPSSSLMTQDADFATAQLAIRASDGRSTLLDVLRSADTTFRPVPGLSKSSLPSSFRNAEGFRFDVLTPTFRRTDSNPMPLKKLGAGAVPLQYLRWLIAEPILAVALAGSGILVRVPQPSRYAVHKLIIAQRRHGTDKVKRQKDLLQAKALIEALLQTDPDALGDAYRSARRQGREGWGEPLVRSLEAMGLELP